MSCALRISPYFIKMHAIPVAVALVVFGTGFFVGQKVFKTEDGKMWGGAAIGGAATLVVALLWVVICLTGLGGF